jgi:NAD(P)-dependent dehydrogenase (short-subunit alcohol dehydrogenase family)
MVASGAAFDGPMESAAYTASKGGIVSMTLALARELGDHGIRVNTISPGAFDTAMVSTLPAEMLAAVPAMTPYPKRMGRPSEFADLALHICTNRFINGSVIRLDGANRMPYFSTGALGA